MRTVFVDSSGFFALIAQDDANHPRALILFRRANDEGWRLVTTNVVVIETHALLLARLQSGYEHAIGFIDMIQSDKYHVERVRKLDEDRACLLARKNRDKTYSLCDALSFVVMERLRIQDAIAFDRHFRQYGRFTIL